MVPILTKLFASSDRGIRRGLLENIASYGPALPDKVVEDQVRRCCAGEWLQVALVGPSSQGFEAAWKPA